MGGVAGLGKGLFQIVRSLAVIFNDENLHRITIGDSGNRA
jgi:hypothetical protein